MFFIYDEVTKKYDWRASKELDSHSFLLSPIEYGGSEHCKKTSKYVKHKVSNVYLSSEPVRLYNISVDGDEESYLVSESNIITHNCKHLLAVLQVLPFWTNTIVRDLRKQFFRENPEQTQTRTVEVEQKPDEKADVKNGGK